MMPTILLALALLFAAAPAARAQIESREGIALQNQILQLRSELDSIRRGAAAAAPVRPGAPSGGNELVGQLLERVNQLEEELRRIRGRVDELDNRNRVLAAEVEKLRGDMDYRLQQLEGTARPGARPPAPAPGRPAPTAAPAPIPAPPSAPLAPAAAPRPPERALADGQAALARRDYAAAETAAREVLAARSAPRAQDAQLLLGEALLGRGDFQNAALAFDDAYRRNRQAGRAPEALVGLANSFLGFGARREACDTLDQLRSEFPRLAGAPADRAAEARRRAGCR